MYNYNQLICILHLDKITLKKYQYNEIGLDRSLSVAVKEIPAVKENQKNAVHSKIRAE